MWNGVEQSDGAQHQSAAGPRHTAPDHANFVRACASYQLNTRAVFSRFLNVLPKQEEAPFLEVEALIIEVVGITWYRIHYTDANPSMLTTGNKSNQRELVTRGVPSYSSVPSLFLMAPLLRGTS